MPEMSRLESLFCRSSPWRFFASHALLPWALRGERLEGEVLEIGSGSGAMAVALLARFPNIRLTATDFDPLMVDELGRRLRSLGPRVVMQRADATALPFGDASFDVVLSILMLHHVGRWEQALSEVVRVLKPGGRLIGCDMLATRGFDWLERTFGSGDERLLHPAQLRAELRSLPLRGSVRLTLGGVAARFRAVKTA